MIYAWQWVEGGVDGEESQRVEIALEKWVVKWQR